MVPPLESLLALPRQHQAMVPHLESLLLALPRRQPLDRPWCRPWNPSSRCHAITRPWCRPWSPSSRCHANSQAVVFHPHWHANSHPLVSFLEALPCRLLLPSSWELHWTTGFAHRGEGKEVPAGQPLLPRRRAQKARAPSLRPSSRLPSEVARPSKHPEVRPSRHGSSTGP